MGASFEPVVIKQAFISLHGSQPSPTQIEGAEPQVFTDHFRPPHGKLCTSTVLWPVNRKIMVVAAAASAHVMVVLLLEAWPLDVTCGIMVTCKLTGFISELVAIKSPLSKLVQVALPPLTYFPCTMSSK